MNISYNTAMLRINILAEMLTSAGIIALAALVYVVLSKQDRIMALVALGW